MSDYEYQILSKTEKIQMIRSKLSTIERAIYNEELAAVTDTPEAPDPRRRSSHPDSRGTRLESLKEQANTLKQMLSEAEEDEG